MLHFLRQGQRPHEVRQIVGQGVKLEPNLVVAELAARYGGVFFDKLGAGQLNVVSHSSFHCLREDDGNKTSPNVFA
jgi:hypothetical protein